MESGNSLSQASTPPELESSGSDTRGEGEALPEDSEREIDLTPGELSKTDDPVLLSSPGASIRLGSLSDLKSNRILKKARSAKPQVLPAFVATSAE